MATQTQQTQPPVGPAACPPLSMVVPLLAAFAIAACTEDPSGAVDSVIGSKDARSPEASAADAGGRDAPAADSLQRWDIGPRLDSCLTTDLPATDAMGKAATRAEKDHNGRRWFLADWAACTRPYQKDLSSREQSYLTRWGEHWNGADYRGHIVSPGSWSWEEYLVIEDGLNYLKLREKSQVVVMAPLGGEVVDIYALTDHGFFHIAPKTKEQTFVGGKESGGLVDGLDDVAKLTPKRRTFGDWATADPISGRVYFDQQLDDGSQRIRYWEKLAPFTVDGKEQLLPSIALAGDLYTKLKSPKGAAIVPVTGGRARFRLGSLTTSYGSLPRLRLWGSRILLSPDGKKTFVQPVANWPVKLDRVVAIDTWLDQLGAEISMPSTIPRGPHFDSHPAFSMRYDSHFYVARHPGSMGGPGLGFRIDTETGELQMLYDSTSVWDLSAGKQPPGWRDLRQTESLPNDGPADAVSLSLTTTCFQTQCPRTGAIISGGWDAAGLRRYHHGFVTSLVAHSQMGMDGGRPEWNNDKVAAFGSLQSAPSIAPNGDVYLASCQEKLVFTDPLRVNGIRIIRLSRKDWPKEQLVNGYANIALDPTRRETLTRQYVQRAIDALR